MVCEPVARREQQSERNEGAGRQHREQESHIDAEYARSPPSRPTRPGGYRRRAAASRGRRAHERCRGAAASPRFRSRSAGFRRAQLPKLSCRACRCWMTIRFDTISGTNKVSESLISLNHALNSSSTQATSAASVSMLAASAVSLVRRGRSTASKCGGKRHDDQHDDADTEGIDDRIAHREQRADGDELRRAAENVRPASAHCGGLVEDSLTVALIVLERVAHRLDDGARRDRRAGECIEIAAVASHGPALRRRIRQRAAAKARRASARRATRTHRRDRASRRGESPARRSGVRPGRSRPAARSARDSRPERSAESPQRPARPRVARDRS